MPIFGVEFLLQVALAAHAVRSGRTQPWLYIIMFMPGIGPLLYVALELGPELLRGRRASAIGANLERVVMPGRAYKALAREVEIAPTVQNKRLLGEECLHLGRVDEAVGLFESCATGLHATDPVVRLGLARALSMKGDFARAADTLEALGRDNPERRTADTHLLYAAALNGAGRTQEALAQLGVLVESYPGEEARIRYAQLLGQTGHDSAAQAQYREVVRRVELQKGPYRRAQREWYDIARQQLGKAA